jgi:hypothetical protein
MTEPVREHNIDLAKLEGLARLGIERAAVFMGLGLHAAYREDFKAYELTDLPRSVKADSIPITLVPDASAATIKKYKREFADWIVPTVLGEVLEHFALYLNHIHYHALVVFHVRGLNKHLGNFEEVRRNFEEAPGLRDKLERLARKEFGITTPHADEIAQLYALRNACTHNFRYVGPKQAREAGELVVRWRTIWMFGEQAGKALSMREQHPHSPLAEEASEAARRGRGEADGRHPREDARALPAAPRASRRTEW